MAQQNMPNMAQQNAKPSPSNTKQCSCTCTCPSFTNQTGGTSLHYANSVLNLASAGTGRLANRRGNILKLDKAIDELSKEKGYDRSEEEDLQDLLYTKKYDNSKGFRKIVKEINNLLI